MTFQPWVALTVNPMPQMKSQAVPKLLVHLSSRSKTSSPALPAGDTIATAADLEKLLKERIKAGGKIGNSDDKVTEPPRLRPRQPGHPPPKAVLVSAEASCAARQQQVGQHLLVVVAKASAASRQLAAQRRRSSDAKRVRQAKLRILLLKTVLKAKYRAKQRRLERRLEGMVQQQLDNATTLDAPNQLSVDEDMRSDATILDEDRVPVVVENLEDVDTTESMLADSDYD
jgi:hypothetical protein